VSAPQPESPQGVGSEASAEVSPPVADVELEPPDEVELEDESDHVADWVEQAVNEPEPAWQSGGMLGYRRVYPKPSLKPTGLPQAIVSVTVGSAMCLLTVPMVIHLLRYGIRQVDGALGGYGACLFLAAMVWPFAIFAAKVNDHPRLAWLGKRLLLLPAMVCAVVMLLGLVVRPENTVFVVTWAVVIAGIFWFWSIVVDAVVDPAS
jgi:hypothetical protein